MLISYISIIIYHNNIHVAKHSVFSYRHRVVLLAPHSCSLCSSVCVCVCVCKLSFRWLALETLFQPQSPLARVAIFAVVITVFMGASRSALAFIYDSQKGHKRGERGWSLWLPLSAIVRPCLAHPLLRAGIPSLITGHPPRCRSNAAIKPVWESGAFVQLECSAINRLRPKVINCVTKEARATTVRGRIGKASACSLHGLQLGGFSPSCALSTSSQLGAALGIRLTSTTGRRYWDQCHGRGSFRLQTHLECKQVNVFVTQSIA